MTPREDSPFPSRRANKSPSDKAKIKDYIFVILNLGELKNLFNKFVNNREKIVNKGNFKS